MKVVAVSGGFDPIHIGHLRMFQEARALGDRLVVILNNDHWLTKKKGFVFMPQEERAEIIAAFPFVDEVVFTFHEEGSEDRSIRKELAFLKPHIFANGGDRRNEDEIPESAVCREHDIEMVFNVGRGGKVQSSSWLTDKLKQQEGTR
ncbi:MAG: adenylyltransferase/cytidyltransferase family protein [Patescibacteria group bacterium]